MIVKTDCMQHYSRYLWPHLQGGVLQQDVLPVSRQREGGGAVVSLESYVLVNVTEYEYSQIGTIISHLFAYKRESSQFAIVLIFFPPRQEPFIPIRCKLIS